MVGFDDDDGVDGVDDVRVGTAARADKRAGTRGVDSAGAGRLGAPREAG